MIIYTYISTHINMPFKYQVYQGHKAIGYPVTTDKIMCILNPTISIHVSMCFSAHVCFSSIFHIIGTCIIC